MLRSFFTIQDCGEQILKYGGVKTNQKYYIDTNPMTYLHRWKFVDSETKKIRRPLGMSAI